MRIYYNNNQAYKVESVTYSGMSIQVNGTTITDLKIAEEFLFGKDNGTGYLVFVDSEEVWFETFKEAYNFAMNEQKDTFRL